MLRFFTGLVIAQLITAGIIALYPGSSLETAMVAAFSTLLMALVISLWFGTVARQLGDQRIATLKQRFAAEREKMNLSAERAKKKLEKKTQAQMQAHERRTKTKANVKVGAAIAVAGGFGLLMMFMQLTTLGLLTMTSVGGAVGGYLMRARREQDLLAAAPDYKMIEGVEVVDESPAPQIAAEESTTRDDNTINVQSHVRTNGDDGAEHIPRSGDAEKPQQA
jgi:Na+-translocating ferredoxin:NAD+ oxidoreductase RnfG subunit